MATLAQCINSSMPAEIVYPSFGQACAEAEGVRSFLELYHKRERTLRQEGSGEGPEEDVADTSQPKRKTGPALRRTRSVSDLRAPVDSDAGDTSSRDARRRSKEAPPALYAPNSPFPPRVIPYF